MAFLADHRRTPGKSSSRRRRHHHQKPPSSMEVENDYYFDGTNSPPRELLAMGAVLDHLCQGGTISDSTQVFFKEANRGMRRRSRSFDTYYKSLRHQKERPAPNSEKAKAGAAFAFLPSSPTLDMACLSACQSPTARGDEQHRYPSNQSSSTFKIMGSAAPPILLNEDSKYEQYDDDEEETAYYTVGEDTLMTYEDDGDETFDDRTYQTARDDANMLLAIPPIDFDPAMLEQYIDEQDVNPDLLGDIAFNVAQLNRNLHEEEWKAEDVQHLFGEWGDMPTSWDGDEDGDEVDQESVNPLAKQMHTMLQRKSSKLFSTSDIKGVDGQQRAAVALRKQLSLLRSASLLKPSAGPKDVVSSRAGERKQTEEEGGKRRSSNGKSVLANASSRPWAASFPAKPVTSPIIALKPLQEETMRFVSSSDNRTHITGTLEGMRGGKEPVRVGDGGDCLPLPVEVRRIPLPRTTVGMLAAACEA